MALFLFAVFLFNFGIVARSNPSLDDSLRRTSGCATWRTSPARPISPKNTVSAGSGTVLSALINAAATAKSAAGSLMRIPPAMFRKISCDESDIPHRVSRTATIMARRLLSHPKTERRGDARDDGATRACTSTSSGRVPSNAARTALPAASSCR